MYNRGLAPGTPAVALAIMEVKVTRTGFKWRALSIGFVLLAIWAVLIFLHVIFDLVWVFFWVGLIGIVVGAVLHLLERSR